MLTLLLLACSGPDDTGSKTNTEDTADTSDTGTVPLTEDFCGVEAIFKADCVMCHSAAGAAGGLDLETDPYNAIVGVASFAYSGQTLVVAGDSAASFLYQKMVNGQGSNGGVMPPAGQLDAATTDIVKAWIDDGASAECTSEETGTTVEAYHPEGWSNPLVHGIAAKFQEDTCLSCHGETLEGVGDAVSCDTCHDAGWRTNCTFCHGGEENNTGAPPEDIDNSTTGISFPEHSAHVEDTDLHSAFACVQCHTTPSDVLSAGHFIVSDSTPGVAELNFAGGLSSSGTYTAGGCSNLYCHGDGTEDNGRISTGDPVDNCNSCHAEEGLSGDHDDHLRHGVSCEECHSETAASRTTIANPENHVNGTLNLTLPSSITYSGGRCDGQCHGEIHEDRGW